jgi:ribosome-associated protein
MESLNFKVTNAEGSIELVSAEDIVIASLGLAIDKSAHNPTVLDLRNLNAFTNFFAIATITNPKQGKAIVDALETFLRQAFNVRPMAVTGYEVGHWILMDYGFFFVHLFQESSRGEYRLEDLWNKSRFIELAEEDFRYKYNELQRYMP